MITHGWIFGYTSRVNGRDRYRLVAAVSSIINLLDCTDKCATHDMPESIVKSFVILESSSLSGSRLRLRFAPDVFDIDRQDPVVRIEVDLTADLETTAQKLSQIEDEYIDDITVDDSQLSIYVEILDAPIQFHGPLTWKREGYVTSDYIAAIKDCTLVQEEQHRKIVHLRRTIDRALRFIDRTIDRIEKKQEMTRSRDSDYAEQIQLLRGARRHLAEDELAE